MEVKCHFWAILDISQMEIPERCALFYQKIKHAGRFGICISRDPQKVTFALVSIFTSVQKVKVRGGALALLLLENRVSLSLTNWALINSLLCRRNNLLLN